MTRAVWFNCAAGVAGDMLLAALIDAGADRAQVADAWAALDVGDYAVTWERVQRCGVAALWTNLVIGSGDAHGDGDGDGHGHGNGHGDAHVHRPAGDVLAAIAAAGLAPRVERRAAAVYGTLAAIEADIHGTTPDAVELHEVGAVDSILDVVGVCAALESLGIDEVRHSAIAVGHGTVATAHGALPNPTPAVVALAARFAASLRGVDTEMELATPTGVALATVIAADTGAGCGPLPAMNVESIGYGAGRADPPGRPNVVQAVVGTLAESQLAAGTGQPALLVEANVDDVTGEVLAHALTALLAAGAYDAWITPTVMKKGRPAHTVHALCDAATFDVVRRTLVDETGTLGVRAVEVERWPQQRDHATVDVGGHPVRVKRSGGRVKVEFDDAAAAAAGLRRPLREVLAEAERAGCDDV